jgi:hypothetical protein
MNDVTHHYNTHDILKVADITAAISSNWRPNFGYYMLNLISQWYNNLNHLNNSNYYCWRTGMHSNTPLYKRKTQHRTTEQTQRMETETQQ